MKARFIVTIPILALAFASGFACSSSSNNHPSTGGSGGSSGSGTGGTAGSGTAGSGGTAGSSTGGTAGTAGDGGTLKDMCTSASDMTGLHKDYPGPDGGTIGITEIATNCAKGCLGNADQTGCTTDCINTATSNAISAGCSKCFVQVFNCGTQKCLAPCLQDQNACNACLCTSGCQAQFTTCSGDPTADCVCTPEAGICQTDGGADASGG